MTTITSKGFIDFSQTCSKELKDKLNQVASHTSVLKRGDFTIFNEKQDVFVFCLVKNGGYYIETFINHYIKIGINHIILIDNGSSDDTIKIAHQFDCVTVEQCNLPFGEYKLAMRRYLIEKYGKNRWCLSVDIDEYWEYPFIDRIKLDSFINYLNVFGYNSCISHQLDLFENSSSLNNMEKETKLDKLAYYDLSNIFRWSILNDKKDKECLDRRLIGFLNGNIISNKNIPIIAGGIRKKFFDITPVLTKVSLFKFESSVNPFLKSSHKISGSYVADISCVLLHKILNSHLKEKSANCIKDGGYFNGSYNYKKIYNKLCKKIVSTPTRATYYNSVNELIENDFLHVSEDYLSYVDSHFLKAMDDGKN